MNEWQPTSSFKQAADPEEKLDIDPAILAWFKARGAGWQEERSIFTPPSIRPRNPSRRHRAALLESSLMRIRLIRISPQEARHDQA
jgi:hypothetical protein